MADETVKIVEVGLSPEGNALIRSIELRDLFAAFALAGVMAGRDAGETNPRWAAAMAYDLASAMMAQRAENESG